MAPLHQAVHHIKQGSGRRKKNIHHVNISYIFPLGDRQQHGCAAVFATMKTKHMPEENNKFSKEVCQHLVFK
jgi:hypothetical protein